MAKIPVIRVWDENTQQYVGIPGIRGEDGTMSEDEFYAFLATALQDAPDITVKDGNVKIESSDGTATQYTSISPAGFVVLTGNKIASVMSETIQFVGSDSAKITGLAAPVNDTDAVNKKYVDDLIAAIRTEMGSST